MKTGSLFHTARIVVLVFSMAHFSIMLTSSASAVDFTELGGERKHVLQVAFAPDGKTVWFHSARDETLSVWDVASGKQKRVFDSQFASDAFNVSAVNKLFVDSESEATDKGYIYHLRLCSTETGKTYRTFMPAKRTCNFDNALSIDGKLFAMTSYDRIKGPTVAEVWEIGEPKRRWILDTQFKFVWSLCFSPDGRLIAIRGDDECQLWSTTTGKLTKSITIEENGGVPCAFSPDGTLLATACKTGKDVYGTRIWNIDNGQERMLLNGHNNYVNSLAFSPDGYLLATASLDSTVKIWDMETEKLITTLPGRSDTDLATSVAFSLDGKTLATSYLQSPVRLWDVDQIIQLRKRK